MVVLCCIISDHFNFCANLTLTILLRNKVVSRLAFPVYVRCSTTSLISTKHMVARRGGAGQWTEASDKKIILIFFKKISKKKLFESETVRDMVYDQLRH